MSRKTLIITGILASLISVYLLYFVANHEFSGTPEKLAEKLIEQNRPADDCFLFRTMDIGPRPSTYELQMRCVYVYASLKKHPDACKLLLPSEYGLSCLSTVGGKLKTGYGCTLNSSGNIRCSSGIVGIYSDIENCLKYPEADVKDWCYTERSGTLKEVNDCDKVSKNDPRIFEECHMLYAYKEKDASLCSQIQDEKRRQYCEIRINAWLQYPELRDSFYFGREVPVD